MSFDLEKFKKSYVARIFVAYAVVVFASMQIFDYLLPIIEAPLWVAQTLTIILFLGFPISLLIGWATQQPSSDSSVDDNVPRNLGSTMTRQKMIIIGLASSALFGFLGLVLMPYMLDQASFDSSSDRSFDVVSSPPNFRALRSSINLGETGRRNTHNTRTDIAISADGMKLAFVTHDNAQLTSEVFIKDLGFVDNVRSLGEISMVGGSGLLYFSEDGDWLHFLDRGRLARVRVEGGAIQNIDTEFNVFRGGGVAINDTVIFSKADDGQLYRISAYGGQPELLEVNSRDESGDRPAAYTWPHMLPNQTHLLVTSSDIDRVGIGNVEIYEVATGRSETIIRNASNARFVESGHIVFMRDSSLWAVPFDSEALAIDGPQVPVIQGIETNSSFGHAAYAISDNGRLFYLSGPDGAASGAATAQIATLDRSGNKKEVLITGQAFAQIELSPSQAQIAMTIYEAEGKSDIWIWDIVRKTLGRRTFEERSRNPVWSPDGKNIFYTTDNSEISVVASDGTSPKSILFSAGNSNLRTTSISPDGTLIFSMTPQNEPMQLFSMDVSAGESIMTMQESIAIKLDVSPVLPGFHGSQVSPDGNWIAYTSTETGVGHIYVRPFPNILDGKWQVSTEPAFQPRWNSDSDELFYWTLEDDQFAVGFELGPIGDNGRPNLITFGAPRPMYSRSNALRRLQAIPLWDYSSANELFFVSEPAEGSNDREQILDDQTSLVMIEDWFSELSSLAQRSQN